MWILFYNGPDKAELRMMKIIEGGPVSMLQMGMWVVEAIAHAYGKDSMATIMDKWGGENVINNLRIRLIYAYASIWSNESLFMSYEKFKDNLLKNSMERKNFVDVVKSIFLKGTGKNGFYFKDKFSYNIILFFMENDELFFKYLLEFIFPKESDQDKLLSLYKSFLYEKKGRNTLLRRLDFEPFGVFGVFPFYVVNDEEFDLGRDNAARTVTFDPKFEMIVSCHARR